MKKTSYLIGAATIFLLCGAGYAPDLQAKDLPPAVPMAAVKAEKLPIPSQYVLQITPKIIDDGVNMEQNMREKALKQLAYEPAQQGVQPAAPYPHKKPYTATSPQIIAATAMTEKRTDENAEYIPIPRRKATPAFTDEKTYALRAKGDESQSSDYIDSARIMVIELFSSQACTQCPQADAKIEKLAENNNVIALSCHIDYFDVEQGSLSRPICASRQAAYSAALALGEKYTPQMLVNGQFEALGSDKNALRNAVMRTKNNAPLRLTVQKNNHDVYTVNLPDMKKQPGHPDYKIWLLGFDNPRELQVADGANAGKIMTYHNVISQAGFIGTWDGKAKSVTFDPKAGTNTKGFAILVHDGLTQKIQAAAQYIYDAKNANIAVVSK